MNKTLSNQNGFLALDFLFSMVLILGFCALLFIVSFSLMMASVTQYVTFAAARNYVVAHIDQASQEARAVAKYNELISSPVLKPLYTNGWFLIDATPNVGDHTKIIPQFAEAAQGVNKFWGVGTSFTATILEFKIPFFGSTVPDGDGEGKGFRTYMGSYLGREPTSEECIAFTAARWEQIKTLGNFGGASNAKYIPQTDDGC